MRQLVLAIVAMIALPLAASEVDGVVLDYDGKPVRGARVLLVDSNWRVIAPPALTDTAGRFRLLHERPDVHARLIARKPALPATSLLLPDLEKARHGITLKLPRGVDVNGIVTSDDGRPVSGVSINEDTSGNVSGLFVALLSDLVPREDWAKSADDGTFSVRVEELSTDLQFAKKGYLTATVPVDVTPSKRPLDVRLKRLQSVRGTLVRKDGTAVGGAIISAPDSLPRETRSAEDGTFELWFLAAGEHVVEAGVISARQTVRAPADDVRLVYDEGLTISGRVIDEATGAPVEKISELSASTDRHAFSPSSLAAGQFTFRGLEPEMVTIFVDAAGYTPETVKVRAEQTKPLIIALKRGLTLHGRVHDAHGKPVDDARISNGRGDVTSDRDGRFEMTALPPDQPARVRISKDGYFEQTITIAPEELGKLADILLPAGLEVKGRVLAPDGKPVFANVSAKSTAYGAVSQSATTDAHGQFEIKGLSPARYDFLVEQGKSDLSGSLPDVDVEQVHEITIQMKRRPAGVVTGRVIGIPEAFTRRMIEVEGAGTASIGADGTFRVEGVPAGSAEVSATIVNLAGRMRRRVKTIEVAVGGETRVELAFETERVLSGRVMHRGRPVSGARISFQGSTRVRATTDLDGRYEARLEPGRYSVEVADRESQPMLFTGQVDVVQSSHYDISIATTEIRVHVFDDETGQPLRNARVTIAPEADELVLYPAMTAADGVAAVEIPLGMKGLVWVYEEGYAMAVADADHADVTVRLVRAADVKVRVVDARDGRTLDACVAIHDAAGRILDLSMKPEADGTAALSARPGNHRVVASARGYGSATVRASVPSGELRIALRRGGTLVLRSNDDLLGTVVILQPNGEVYASRCEYPGAIPLNGGVTTITDMAAGSYTLEVTPVGQKPRRYPVTVVEGTSVSVQID